MKRVKNKLPSKKEKAKNRAFTWAMFDYFEGKIERHEIEERARDYLQSGKEIKKQLGFDPMEL